MPRIYYQRSAIGVFFRWLLFFMGLFLVASAVGWMVSHLLPFLLIAGTAWGVWRLAGRRR